MHAVFLFYNPKCSIATGKGGVCACRHTSLHVATRTPLLARPVNVVLHGARDARVDKPDDFVGRQLDAQAWQREVRRCARVVDTTKRNGLGVTSGRNRYLQ